MPTVIGKNAAPASDQSTGQPRKNFEDTQTPQDRIMARLTNSIETGDRHPYLIEHEVSNFDLSLDKDGHLLGVGVNLRKSFVGTAYRPTAQTIFSISPEGRTTLEPGAPFFGAALLIGHHLFRKLAKSASNPAEATDIYVTEDYVTGAFLHMRTGKPVAVAFRNANVKNVVKFFRGRFPQTRVIVCLNSEDSKKTGRNRARDAALKAGAWVTYPVFNRHEKFLGYASFNDLCMAHGPEAALRRLESGIRRGK